MRRTSLIPMLTMWIIMMILCNGCWNRTELNDLAVVLAIGIDLIEENEYEITVQMVDPSQMSKNRYPNRSATTTFSERGKTIFEAFRKITTKASRKMYFSHMKLLIIDEQTAKKGVNDSLDLLFRNHEVRPDFYMAVVRQSKAREVMDYVTPTEVLPAMDMYKSLRVSEKFWAPTSPVNVKDIMQTLTREGIEPVLTGMKLIGDIEEGEKSTNVENPRIPGNFKYTGIGVFRDDRLLGWLNEADSKAFSYIMNKITSTVGSVKCPHSQGEFVSEVTHSKVKVKPKIKNGIPSIMLEAYVEANVGEVRCKVDLSDEKSLLAMNQAATDALMKILTDGVRGVQMNYGADIFGFGEAFHRKYPHEWKQWKEEWDEKFKKLPVEIKIDYQLRSLGNIISPFSNNLKKEE